MLYRKHSFFIFITIYFSLCCGWVGAGDIPAAANRQFKVFVSILPTEYFVQRIAGSRALVETLVQPGHSPATYSPTPKQMADLASARVYFKIGVPFENAFLPKLYRILPDLKVVDLQQGIDLQILANHHDHDDHGHEEGDIDPHTWLDPMLALKQSKIIMNSLIEVDPRGKKEYEANYRQLADDLRELDRYLRAELAPFAGSKVYVFHPAYGYFCRAYNLRQDAVTPGGKEPGARYLAHLIEQAKQDRVKMIFVQPQFSNKAADTIARAINGSVVVLDPLAYDYINNLKNMAREITRSFQGKEPL